MKIIQQERAPMTIIMGTKRPDLLVGTVDNDIISGKAAADTIFGNAGDDLVFGGRGADTLYGGVGNDSLYGGRGKDTLNGGPGSDVLWGGRGRDKFVFDDAPNGRGVDAIGDFRHGKDKIVLDLDVFDIPRDGWFGTVVTFDEQSRELSYNGEVVAIIRGDAKVTDQDFLFV